MAQVSVEMRVLGVDMEESPWEKALQTRGTCGLRLRFFFRKGCGAGGTSYNNSGST